MQRHLLRPVYRSIVHGLPGIGSPEEVAARARTRAPNLEAAGNRIVSSHIALGASQGFIFGLPGLLLLPATLPANLAGAAAVQLHMTAALAVLTGHSLDDPSVCDRCIDCLLRGNPGEETHDETTELAVRTTTKFAERGARWAGERLVRRGAHSALRRIGIRSMPLVGGLIGGVADGWQTRSVARVARREFPAGPTPVRPAEPGSGTTHSTE